MGINPAAVQAAIAGQGEGARPVVAPPQMSNTAQRLNPMLDRTAAVAGYADGSMPTMRGPGQIPRNFSA
jgi:hypothetical protein